MTSEDALRIFKLGLQRLYESPEDLILLSSAQERSSVAVLMHHMRNIRDDEHRKMGPAQGELPISIDVEYHRAGANAADPKFDGLGNRTPDLIVHRRTNDLENLLVAEFKSSSGLDDFIACPWTDALAIDRQKIARLVQHRAYKNGLVVMLKPNRPYIEKYDPQLQTFTRVAYP